jgi:hypothetical protein
MYCDHGESAFEGRPGRMLHGESAFEGRPGRVLCVTFGHTAISCLGSLFPHVCMCMVQLVLYFPSHRDDALEKNQEREFERNRERFQFLKWGAKAFANMQIIPPGSGIVHQVRLRCAY